MGAQRKLSTGVATAAVALGVGGAFAACTMDYGEFRFDGVATTSGTTNQGAAGSGGALFGGGGSTTTTGTTSQGGSGLTSTGGGGTGGGLVGGGGSGTGGGCTAPGDCGTDTDCLAFTCDNQACGSDPALRGTPCNDDGGDNCDGAGQCISCGVVVDPPGGDPCPGECSSCDGDNDICVIDCSGSNACTGTVTCPVGYACTVNCGNLTNNSTACTALTIECPADYACDVTCAGNAQHPGCNGVTIAGDTGTAALACANGTCIDTTLSCGDEQCVATCSGNQSTMTVTANNACSCSRCGGPCS